MNWVLLSAESSIKAGGLHKSFPSNSYYSCAVSEGKMWPVAALSIMPRGFTG